MVILSPIVATNPPCQLFEFHRFISERRKRASSRLLSSSSLNSLTLSTVSSSSATSRAEARYSLPPPPFVSLDKWRKGIFSSFYPRSNRRTTSSLEEKHLDEAVLYLERMVGRGLRPDFIACSELLEDLCKSGRVRKSIRVMELMVRTGKRPNSSLFTYLVERLCRRGELGQALRLVDKMVSCGCLPVNRTCNWLVRGSCTFGKLQRSLRLVEKFVGLGFVPNEFTYAYLLELACKERGVDEAVRLLHEIVAKGGRPNLINYNVLLTGFCREGRVEDALRLFRSLPSMGFSPSAASYNTVLRRLCYDCQWDAAVEILAEMTMEGCPKPNLVTYSTLIAALSFHGYTGQALQVLDLIRANGVELANCYNPILMQYSREGKTELVVALLDLMKQRGVSYNSWTYQAVALLCRGGEPGTNNKAKDAFTILRRLGNSLQSSSSSSPSMHKFYKDVLSDMCKQGETYVALQLLEQLTLSGEFVPDTSTYSMILRGVCFEGMLEGALEIFRLMLLVEEQQQDCSAAAASALGAPSADNYDALMIGLCKAGRTDVAFDVFELMVTKGRMPRLGSYRILVGGLANYEEECELAADVLRQLHRLHMLPSHMVKTLSLKYNLDLEDFPLD